MTTNLHKESATIYAFPVGGRAGLKRPARAGQAPASEVVSMDSGYPVRIASGSGWYHEEALIEDEKSRKN